MTDLDALVDTLLFEGYALYPYTPGATKNATPTPFGIAYPPAYASGSGATHDRMRIECALALEAPASPHGGHRALPRRRGRATPGARAPDRAGGAGRGRVRLRRDRGPRRARARRRPHGALGSQRDRGPRGAGPHGRAAAQPALHPRRRARPRRRASSRRWRRRGASSVNTWPVLASDADDVVLGAAIMLPDHPQLAPESRGSLFDSTEIEEALLLHVMALSDEERAGTAEQDPAVRAMIERAARTTPEEIMALHGRVTVKEPEQGDRGEATVDGVTDRPARRRRAAARAGPQRPGPPGRGAPGDDRADLRRLRRARAAGRDDRRRCPGRT